MDDFTKKRLERLERRLELYCEAEEKILSGQSYEMKGIKLDRANLSSVRAEIDKLETQVALLKKNGGKIRTFYGVPR